MTNFRHSYCGPTDHTAETHWEMRGVQAGVARARAAMEGTLDTTRPGLKMIHRIVKPLAEHIREAQDAIHRSMVTGTNWSRDAVYLTMLPAHVVSFIVAKCVFSSNVTDAIQERPLTSMAVTIGQRLYVQHDYAKWKTEEAAARATDPDHHNTFEEFLRVTTTVSPHSIRRFQSRIGRIRETPWKRTDQLRLGVACLQMLAAAVPEWFTIRKKMNRRGQPENHLCMTSECWTALATLVELSEVNEPVLIPMVVPPIPWEWTSESYEGGYVLHQTTLVKVGGINTHTASLERPISAATLHAVNSVQDTPWRINDLTYNLMVEAYNSNMSIGGLPFGEPADLPWCADDEWERMGREERAEHLKVRAELHGKNATLIGRRKSFLGQIRVARTLRNREFWFPHGVDFRTRLYPLPQDLHPQSNDLGKSLLRFSEGKPLGDRGFFWLSVRLASCWGHDKLSFQDRYQWCIDNAAMIMDCADNPLDGSRAWLDADEPWQTIATCFEWAGAARREGGTGGYVSYLPVNMDGSCNGLQHLSAMALDPIGARMTNVAANTERQDIYESVAKRVAAMVSSDAANGKPEAHQWVGKITRKTVKRAVMTTPYGVTSRGISQQLVDDGFCDDMEDRGAASRYMRDCIDAALDETLTSGRAIMAWLRDCAKHLALQGKPLWFTTPTGNRVQQGYYDCVEGRVDTALGRLVLWREDKNMPIKLKKQSQAAPPNVIHAFDAAHLVLAVNRMCTEIERPSFAMIHDSFGCHAADVDIMHRVIRETFVNIYSDNWLDRLQTEFDTQSDNGPCPHWSAYVTRGSFDILDVMRSDFFFA